MKMGKQVGEMSQQSELEVGQRGSFIENDGSRATPSSQLAERLESEELEKNYHLQKRPRREDADVDQKLERLKEYLLAELEARDNNSPLLPTSLPFVKRIQQKTIPKKSMMSILVAYNGMRNPQEHFLTIRVAHSLGCQMCKVFSTSLSGPVQTWFNNLECGSIKNFIDLASVFICRLSADSLSDDQT